MGDGDGDYYVNVIATVDCWDLRWLLRRHLLDSCHFRTLECATSLVVVPKDCSCYGAEEEVAMALATASEQRLRCVECKDSAMAIG